MKQRTLKRPGDYEQGYNDRKAGYYDKWYRYNRSDDGAEYNKGCVAAVDSGMCPDHFTLIEANNLIFQNRGEGQ